MPCDLAGVVALLERVFAAGWLMVVLVSRCEVRVLSSSKVVRVHIRHCREMAVGSCSIFGGNESWDATYLSMVPYYTISDILYQFYTSE